MSSRAKMGQRNIAMVKTAMANLGTDLTGEQIGTIVSLYFESLVHEANLHASRSPRVGERVAARQVARTLQWFADTAMAGGLAMED